jgi:ACS family hexuronate transporter-like MFS transporter
MAVRWLPRTASRVVDVNTRDVTVATIETVGQRIGRYRWLSARCFSSPRPSITLTARCSAFSQKIAKANANWLDRNRLRKHVAAFSAAYALGLLLAGRLMDRIGTRIGYAAALVWWSLAAMGHALARTPFGFGVARAALGIGEAGNFPLQSRLWRNGFRRKSVRLLPGSLTRGRTSARSLLP